MFRPELVDARRRAGHALERGAARDALALATELRRAGLRVDVYPEADKLGKQFKYASRGVRVVVVVGDEELKRDEVTLKNMTSGEQQTVSRESVAATAREALPRRAAMKGEKVKGEKAREGCFVSSSPFPFLTFSLLS